MTALLLAEISKGRLGDVTAKALSAASQLGEAIHILVVGQDCDVATMAMTD